MSEGGWGELVVGWMEEVKSEERSKAPDQVWIRLKSGPEFNVTTMFIYLLTLCFCQPIIFVLYY